MTHALTKTKILALPLYRLASSQLVNQSMASLPLQRKHRWAGSAERGQTTRRAHEDRARLSPALKGECDLEAGADVQGIWGTLA
jgi:hypothetical protein